MWRNPMISTSYPDPNSKQLIVCIQLCCERAHFDVICSVKSLQAPAYEENSRPHLRYRGKFICIVIVLSPIPNEASICALCKLTHQRFKSLSMLNSSTTRRILVNFRSIRYFRSSSCLFSSFSVAYSILLNGKTMLTLQSQSFLTSIIFC